MALAVRWLFLLISAGWHQGLAVAQDTQLLRGAADTRFPEEDTDPVGLHERKDDFPDGIPGKTHARLNITYYRWLWWPGILYLFWSMAHVCDIHFVRTIEVICERFHIPDDVAGATLMALGCNGPELALNMINIWQPSSIGVGAVVGGEVFNVLVIIGTAVLATPNEYMPLKLSKLSFNRDIFFYIASVLLLYFALRDGKVSREDALMLLFGGFCYIMSVIYLRRIVNWMMPAGSSFVQPLVDRQCSKKNLEDWDMARQGTDPLRGSLLRIRADMRSRLTDRNHQFEDRFAFLLGESFVISAVADPTVANETQCDVDMVYDSCEKENHWHRAGLVKLPKTLEEAQRRQLLPKTLPGLAELGLFRNGPWEIISLQDILFCEASHHGFFLHVNGHLGSELTLELVPLDEVQSSPSNQSPKMKAMKSDACVEAWYQNFRDRLKNSRRKSSERPKGKKLQNFVMDWIAWLQFPVKSLAGATIPDMDCPDTQHWYPLAFLMSMVWLGILSSLVVNACDGIHRDFDIPDNVLGFTVAAAGTSFPNVFSGMCVARQGKAGMAVANALGANVQNVFLALAIPWTIQAVLLDPSGEFPLVVNGFEPAIVEIFLTLLPLVLIYYCCSSLPKWSGSVFLVTYVIYLVCALKQQSSGCVLWPVTCTLPSF